MAIELTEKQRAFIEDEANVALFCGGVGAGKTTAGAYFAYKMAKEFPAVRGLIAANTYGQLKHATLTRFFEILEAEGVGYVYGKRPPKDWPVLHVNATHQHLITLENGATIHAASLWNPHRLRGLEIGWYWMDEARDSSREALEILESRKRVNFETAYKSRGFRCLGRVTSTPNGFNWMYDVFANESTKWADSALIRASTRDNPHLPTDYADLLEQRMDKRKAEQEIDGRFVNLSAGRAYEFDRDVHVDEVEQDPALPLILSFDFNVAPMCAVVAQGQFPRGGEPQVRVLDEIVIPDGAQTGDLVEAFVERWGGRAMQRPVEVYGDVSGHARDTRGCDSDYAIIERILKANVPDVIMRGSKRTNPRVKDRIAAVNALLNPAVGPPRLTIHKRCHYLIRDLEQVSFKPGTERLDQAANPQLTHVSDALGYPIADRHPVRRSTGVVGVDPDAILAQAQKPARRLRDLYAKPPPEKPEGKTQSVKTQSVKRKT